MRPFQARSGSRVLSILKSRTRRFFRLALQRRVVCSAIAFNLLLWPGPGVVAEPFIALASQVIKTRVAFYSYEAFFFRRLFSQAASRPRRETMADRAAAVARIQINPLKFVGYEDDGATFTATPSDFLDRTVQGVKFSWESSDTNKLQIDDAGRARFLQAGLVRITCRAGLASATAPVLIKPGGRPRQSDAEWRIDQQRITVNGDVVGENGAAKLIDRAESARCSRRWWINLRQPRSLRMGLMQTISPTINFGTSRVIG